MANQYSITIINESGTDQNYALYNEKPLVTGSEGLDVYQNAYAVSRVPRNSEGNFTMYTQYEAVVGYYEGKIGDAVTVSVAQQRRVTLGSQTSSGKNVPGTTLEFKIASNDSPCFADDETRTSDVNAFAIKTPAFDSIRAEKGKYFLPSSAQQGLAMLTRVGNWLVGLAGANPAKGMQGLSAVFVPEPSVTYNITPSNKFYVVPKMYTKGAIIDVTKVGNACAVDFTKFPKGDVSIKHASDGTLTIQE